MSLIETVAPQQASGKVSALYQEVEQAFGRVPNAFQMYSGSPDLMAQQWAQIRYYMEHPALSFPLLATIRMLVSQENECEYCVGYNEAMLIQRAGLSAEQVAAAKRNPADAPLPDKEKAMLLFVLKATQTPKAVDKSDLDRLRGMGWRDGDILDAVHHGARNMAVDVVFNTFKIDNDF
jgi:uncharacterized peroxidase-related enzyme